MNISARRLLLSELTIWLVLAGLGVYFLMPLRQKLHFGIDLVGGTFLTLHVQTDKAIESNLIDNFQSIESRLRSTQDIRVDSHRIEKNEIILTFDSLQDTQSAASYIKTEFPDFNQKVQEKEIRLSYSDAKIKEIKVDAVARNIEVLRTRVNRLGVADIPISSQGENIIVEMPDVSDPQQAKNMIGRAAQLDFRLVEKYAPTREDILYEFDGDLPGDKEILPGRDKREGFYLVTKYPEITGKYLKDAFAGIGGDSGVQPVVSFRLSDEGGQRFFDLTSRNIGRQLAIVLDDVIIQSANINSAIRTDGQISGRFSPDETKELALLLKSGAFVAPVTFEEERQIGPSLGHEAIRQGITSCVVGMLLLLVFSLFYYRLPGLFAFVTLIYNLLIVLLGMAWFGATLTLPGIAGMVLTVGMAIDASILIYEEIRELMSQGVNVKEAVNRGFSGAAMVIIDANITTFIVGAVLYWFGTGPIQGFAVTMMLGIGSTLITGLFFLKAIFKFVFENFSVKKLSF